jgi:uncharacterized membrane protein YdjX (TVP38/TMEM64 family)
MVSFNLVNSAAGLTTVSLLAFTLATGLGILPVTIVMVMLGYNMSVASWEMQGALALSGPAVWGVIYWGSLRYRRSAKEKEKKKEKI